MRGGAQAAEYRSMSQLDEIGAIDWAQDQEVTNTCSTEKLKETIVNTGDVHAALNEKFNDTIGDYAAVLNRGQDINETLTKVTGNMISVFATFAKQNNIPTTRPIGDFVVDENAIIPIDQALLMLFGPTVLTDIKPHRVEAIAREIRRLGKDRASLIEEAFQDITAPPGPEMIRPAPEDIDQKEQAYNNLLTALEERGRMNDTVITMVLSDDTVIDVKITAGDYEREIEFIKFYAILRHYDKEVRLFISGLTHRFNGTLDTAIERARHVAVKTRTTTSLAIANPLNTALDLITNVYNAATKNIPKTVTTMYKTCLDFLENARVEDMDQLADIGRQDMSKLSFEELFQRLKDLNKIKFQCLAEANILYYRNLPPRLAQQTMLARHHSAPVHSASSGASSSLGFGTGEHLPDPPGGVYPDQGFGFGTRPTAPPSRASSSASSSKIHPATTRQSEHFKQQQQRKEHKGTFKKRQNPKEKLKPRS